MRHSDKATIGDPFSLLSKNWLVWRIGRRHLKSVVHLLHGQVLDIGCGEQPLRGVLMNGRVARIWGLDRPQSFHPDEMVDIFGSALELPFHDASFDGAVCMQVLEHVPEPLELLQEARRVLKAGSHLVLTAPHIWSVHEAPYDYYRYTLYGLRHLLGKAGFEVIEVRPMAGYFVTAAARLCYFLEHFDRWGLQILVKPAYFVVQCAGALLDRIYCDTAETWNYLAVGRVPQEGSPAGEASARRA